MLEQLNNQQQRIDLLVEELAVMRTTQEVRSENEAARVHSSRMRATACGQLKALLSETPGVVRCCAFGYSQVMYNTEFESIRPVTA